MFCIGGGGLSAANLSLISNIKVAGILSEEEAQLFLPPF